jgi:ASC-1-like (ASCH) protein
MTNTSKRVVLRFAKSGQREFEAIKAGTKTVETRAATMRYKGVTPGDTLVLICGSERLEKIVQKVSHYPSVLELLNAVEFRLISPWANSPSEVSASFNAYAGYDQKIKLNGLAAFWI